MFTWLDEPFASEAIDGLPDGHIKRKETNTQIDQLLGGLLCSHQPTCLSSLIVDSVNWEIMVHISNSIGEVKQTFHGRQAQPCVDGFSYVTIEIVPCL